ncbi:nitrous oxide reductase accessory protein NosL [Roseovarius sp. S1116L3]|uniref:nitrous oxide reductase accessory protein NosL n=1 Tax=Roseovarius roseus TaxID=3342636 RepID=UPI00372A5087
MKLPLALLCILALAACRDEAEAPDPVRMTQDAVGHFCQMNLLEHAGPKAQVHLEGLPGMPLFFSQVRDAIAYQRMPEQSHAITAIYVQDVGSVPSWDAPGQDHWIAAEDAYYVLGSDRMGGMGAPETVSFAAEGAAEDFAAAHGGRILRLTQIPDAAVLAPVADGPQSNADDEADFSDRLRKLSNERKN